MDLRLKAAAIVAALIGGSFVVGLMLSQLTPQMIIWFGIAGLLYVMYNLVLSYLKFNAGVEKLNESAATREAAREAARETARNI
jgi:hypothetical protein